MKKNLLYEVYVELFLLALGAFYLGTAFSIKESSLKLNDTNLPPKFYPILVGSAWVLSVLFVLIKSIIKYKKCEDDGQPAKLKFVPKNVLVASGAFILYIVGLYLIGFIPSNILFTMGILTYLQKEKWKANLIYTIIFTAIVFVLFNFVLTIYLPEGLIFR